MILRLHISVLFVIADMSVITNKTEIRFLKVIMRFNLMTSRFIMKVGF
jgi:hypothetical protein